MKDKKIDLIIIHYHLLPGGVTDVIKHSLPPLAGLEMIKSIKILCGKKENTNKMQDSIHSLNRKRTNTPISLEVLPELDYRSNQKAPLSPESLKNLLMTKYGSSDSIWLIHNYQLGKNWAFTSALNSIAREGKQKMIYQIHDFPECARYSNLNELKTNLPGSLYPSSESLKYCVINVRDFKIMKDAGMTEERIHLLENPVPLQENPSKKSINKPELKQKLKANAPMESKFDPEGDLWLYPVRSIRRKNVLEGGFLCNLLKDPVNLILTLPGISVQEKKYSDLCEKAFAQGLIPGFWGTGTLPAQADISYQEMISGSDLIFSSSVQEGFGYMYLNALVWQKPLLARQLDIMEGFTPLMKDYPAHLYDSVLVPLDTPLKKQLQKDYGRRLDELKAYLPSGIKEKLHDDLHLLLIKESVDFSYLSPADQYSFLEKCQSPRFVSECRDLNAPLLEQIESLKSLKVSDKENLIYENYGDDAYQKAFMRILKSFEHPYKGMKEEEGEEETVDKSLQREFSRLEFFRLLYR
jgi:hypothetical protein